MFKKELPVVESSLAVLDLDPDDDDDDPDDDAVAEDIKFQKKPSQTGSNVSTETVPDLKSIIEKKLPIVTREKEEGCLKQGSSRTLKNFGSVSLEEMSGQDDDIDEKFEAAAKFLREYLNLGTFLQKPKSLEILSILI